MQRKTLSQVVEEQPFPDFAEWWPVGATFAGFMSRAIVSQWRALPGNDGNLEAVKSYVTEYLRLVYGRPADPALVEDFASRPAADPLQSGQFDALSYAFFRSAYELLAQHPAQNDHPLAQERRLFTQRVGRIFFGQVRDHLKLALPAGLDDARQFAQLKDCVQQVGEFLQQQGYLRDHFRFSFDVAVEQPGYRINQTEADFLPHLHANGLAYALYEMGYPIILPSAVYLFHTVGEAQHHSSRTIEELFALTGYQARETDDFDPTGHPSKRVVELWEIREC